MQHVHNFHFFANDHGSKITNYVQKKEKKLKFPFPDDSDVKKMALTSFVTNFGVVCWVSDDVGMVP